MQYFLYLVLGALIGAVIGWAIYAAYYVHFRRFEGYFGIRVLREPVSESFWRTSPYVALIGALIGAAVVVWKFIV